MTLKTGHNVVGSHLYSHFDPSYSVFLISYRMFRFVSCPDGSRSGETTSFTFSIYAVTGAFVESLTEKIVILGVIGRVDVTLNCPNPSFLRRKQRRVGATSSICDTHLNRASCYARFGATDEAQLLLFCIAGNEQISHCS